MKDRIFVDSGAHSLYIKHVVENKEGYAYFETDAFWKYVDDYATFIKKNAKKIKIFANVDVIRNPELSYKVYKYLINTHKLNPLGVVHFNTDLKWLKKYMEDSDYIAIGGLGQKTSINTYVPFADSVFKMISDKEGYPTHKIHGFAITSPMLLHRYPFYSSDSTSWVQYGRYGAISMPRTKNGKKDFKRSPLFLYVSLRAVASSKILGKHFNTLTKIEQDNVVAYIQEKGLKFGVSEKKRIPIDQELKENESLIKKFKTDKLIEVIKEAGVSNNNFMRDIFNANYAIDLANSVPEWPWKFKYTKQNTFL